MAAIQSISTADKVGCMAASQKACPIHRVYISQRVLGMSLEAPSPPAETIPARSHSEVPSRRARCRKVPAAARMDTSWQHAVHVTSSESFALLRSAVPLLPPKSAQVRPAPPKPAQSIHGGTLALDEVTGPSIPRFEKLYLSIILRSVCSLLWMHRIVSPNPVSPPRS